MMLLCRQMLRILLLQLFGLRFGASAEPYVEPLETEDLDPRIEGSGLESDMKLSL